MQALIFDATGITEGTQLHSVYAFFHDALRSLGKEARNGITSNLLRVAEGADIDSALRFFLSPRSAYGSGQVVTIDAPATAPASWATPLAGKRALVTGAARGIGASIAAVLAEHGAIVTGLDQTMFSIEDASPSGGAHATFGADIAAPEAPAEIAAALTASGGIDIVVHNAGITRDKTIARMTAEMWDSVIDINLLAQARIDEILLRQGVLRADGRIVAVSSISGIAGNRGQTNYATSKAGVIGRVHAMAPELRPRGITINAVAPGFIETHMRPRACPSVCARPADGSIRWDKAACRSMSPRPSRGSRVRAAHASRATWCASAVRA